jgi:NAD+ synthase
MPQSQEEFYFSLPYDLMDLCLFGRNNGVPINDIALATGLTAGQVNRVFRDIDQKRRTTQYLHLAPELASHVPEIEAMTGRAHHNTDPHR